MFARLLGLIRKFIATLRYLGWRTAISRAWGFLRRAAFLHFERSGRTYSSGITDPLPGLTEGKPAAVRHALKSIGTCMQTPVSIHGKAFLACRREAQLSKTVVLLAHWDPQGIVDPYVRHLCEHFHSLGWKVVLTSAAPVGNLEEVRSAADAIVYRTCPGYDFTSWKAALEVLPELYDVEELILCNDSVFGPVGSYEPMHDRMRSIPCDFWGICESHEQHPHLQSFHLVFRTKALRHPCFRQFIAAIPLSSARAEAISVESRLTLWFAMHGLRPGAYAMLPKMGGCGVNPAHDGWRSLLAHGVPCLKRELLQTNLRKIQIDKWAAVFLQKGYPLDLVFRYFWRQGVDITVTQCSGERSGCFPPDVFSLQQSIVLSTPEQLVHTRRIAAVLHVYYPEIFPEVLSAVQHLPGTAHLLVSTDTTEKACKIEQLLENSGFASFAVRVFPNRGWDMGAFFSGFGATLEGYDLVLKLHAKASLQHSPQVVQKWRRLIFSSLCGTSERVRQILSLFAEQPKLGVLAPPNATVVPSFGQDGNHNTMNYLLSRHGIHLKPQTAIDFPAGSMFWCRPAVLRPWLEQRLSFEDFAPSSADLRDGTLAHALERLIFFGCGLAGMTWGRIAPVGYDHLKPQNSNLAEHSS